VSLFPNRKELLTYITGPRKTNHSHDDDNHDQSLADRQLAATHVFACGPSDSKNEVKANAQECIVEMALSDDLFFVWNTSPKGNPPTHIHLKKRCDTCSDEGACDNFIEMGWVY